MKLQKVLFIFGIGISLITFILSLIISINNKCDDKLIAYFVNVLLAIFGGSIILMATSIVCYFIERKKYEVQYATFARSFLLQICRFLNIYNSRTVNAKEVYSLAGNIHAAYDMFAFEKNIDILGYFFNGKRKEKLRHLHEIVNMYAEEISSIEFKAQEAINNGNDDFTFQSAIMAGKLEGIFRYLEEMLYG